MSLAASAASSPTDTAVPTPGIVDAIPDAASSIAPLKSPDIKRCPANNSPAPIPTKGIFFSSPLPSAFAPTFAIALPPTLAATFFAPFFNSAFPALLAPFNNLPPDLATLATPFVAFLPPATIFLTFLPSFKFLNLCPIFNFLPKFFIFLKVRSKFIPNPPFLPPPSAAF